MTDDDDKPAGEMEVQVVELGPYVLAFLTRLGDHRAAPGNSEPLCSISATFLRYPEVSETFHKLVRQIAENLAQAYGEMLTEDDERGPVPPNGAKTTH